MRLRLPVLILVFLTACSVALAADPLPEKLSLSDAVVAALERNPQLVQSKDSHLTNLSRLRIAGLTNTYEIGNDTNYERIRGSSDISSRMMAGISYENFFGTEASLSLSPFGMGSERGSVGLSIRHPLLKGKGVLSNKSNLLAGARSTAGISDKQLYLSRQTTVMGVIQAYYRAVAAEQQVAVQESAMKIAGEVLDGARKRADEGLVAGIEVSRAEATVAQSSNRLNLQKQSARAALDRLMLAIGTGVGQTTELADTVPESNMKTPTLADAVNTALANRAELSIFDLRMTDQKRLLARTEDELRPSFDAVAGFNSTAERRGVISGSLFDVGSLVTGFEFRFPLDKRITSENRDTARREHDVLERLRVFEMEQIAEQVRDAYREVESARTSIDIFSQNLSVAQERLTIAQRMVEEGLSSNREVLDAQESLTAVESSLLSAKIDLYLANINLREAMGEDLTELVIR